MSYRDDLEAAEARCAALEKELASVRAELGDREQLEASERRLEDELLVARTLRDRSRSSRSLPLLDEMRVASPCKANWDEMTGDERVRFCEGCAKNVYNLSGMTRVEAERLLSEHEYRVCVRFYRRKDGTVLTSDCSVGVRRRRIRGLVFAAGGLGALATGILLARGGTEVEHHPIPVEVQAPPEMGQAEEVQAPPEMGQAEIDRVTPHRNRLLGPAWTKVHWQGGMGGPVRLPATRKK